MKANILIDETGHARLADFGLLTIVSDGTNTISSNSFLQAGSYRWMSPELFDPESFNLKDSRQTKYSDCYALGMVIYEVLGGLAPFSQHGHYVVVLKVSKGERPKRPEGEERVWFADDIWSILEGCWKPSPGDRPTISVVLQCLEEVSRSWIPPSPRTLASLPTTSPGRKPDPGTEESTNESEAPSPSQAGSSQQSQSLPPKGDPTNEISIRSSAHEFLALRYTSRLLGARDERDGSQRIGLGGTHRNSRQSESDGCSLRLQILTQPLFSHQPLTATFERPDSEGDMLVTIRRPHHDPISPRKGGP